jgi:sphingomyelin phosphodiesterase
VRSDNANKYKSVYEVDPVTFGVLDVVTYYTDITSSTYQSGPVWQKLYSAKEAYGSLLGVTDAAAELTPAFWHNVTALFETEDAVFQEYIARKTRDYSTSTCTGTCKTAEICQLRAAQAQYNCVTVSPGVNFKRDTNSGVVAAGECDGSQALPILAALPGTTGIAALGSAIASTVGSAVLNQEVPANYTVNGTSYWR